ncbi:hypothetical protein [Bacteriophage sp.]|nr:hypothetical protein [Bacteriophage sp.]
MNANELNRWVENSPYTERDEVIILLRQQAALIEILEDELKAMRKELNANQI